MGGHAVALCYVLEMMLRTPDMTLLSYDTLFRSFFVLLCRENPVALLVGEGGDGS